MATATVAPPYIHVNTDLYSARVDLEGYVSGVSAGSFVDKQTGARDLGFGLDIVDFLLEPGPDDERYEPHRYHAGDPYHGNLPKCYVELPQICTQAKKLEYEVIEGGDFVAVRQWFRWTDATAGRSPGSLWEQWLVFPDGKRYFYACDTVTSVNAVDDADSQSPTDPADRSTGSSETPGRDTADSQSPIRPNLPELSWGDPGIGVHRRFPSRRPVSVPTREAADAGPHDPRLPDESGPLAGRNDSLPRDRL